MMNTLTLTLTLLFCFSTCRALVCSVNETFKYADVSTGCQMYHFCEDSQLKSLKCLSGQAFDRQTSECKDASTVPCYGIWKRSLIRENADQETSMALRNKLTSQFSDILRNFLDAQRQGAQKEKERFLRALLMRFLTMEPRAEPSSFPSGNGRPSTVNLTDLESSRQIQAQTYRHTAEEPILKLLKASEEAVIKLEADIVEVNNIVEDIITLVREQGEVIESFEANVKLSQQLEEERRLKALNVTNIILFIVALGVLAGVVAVLILDILRSEKLCGGKHSMPPAQSK